jgi:hypothetical protein
LVDVGLVVANTVLISLAEEIKIRSVFARRG